MVVANLIGTSAVKSRLSNEAFDGIKCLQDIAKTSAYIVCDIQSKVTGLKHMALKGYLISHFEYDLLIKTLNKKTLLDNFRKIEFSNQLSSGKEFSDFLFSSMHLKDVIESKKKEEPEKTEFILFICDKSHYYAVKWS